MTTYTQERLESEVERIAEQVENEYNKLLNDISDSFHVFLKEKFGESISFQAGWDDGFITHNGKTIGVYHDNRVAVIDLIGEEWYFILTTVLDQYEKQTIGSLLNTYPAPKKGV